MSSQAKLNEIKQRIEKGEFGPNYNYMETEIKNTKSFVDNLKKESLKDFFNKLEKIKLILGKINFLDSTKGENYIGTNDLDKDLLKEIIIEIFGENNKEKIKEDINRFKKINNYDISLILKAIENKLKNKIKEFTQKKGKLFSQDNEKDLFFIFKNNIDLKFLEEIEKYRKKNFEIKDYFYNNHTNSNYVVFINKIDKREILVNPENNNFKVINKVELYKTGYIGYILDILNKKK